ncbi:shikimate kinase [Paenibacillus sp. J31TS4]|uniref:shikimate kinase n=1 Tax=Paenibacillus sp. J31TS4 TaxID=2807195 RepID=UPI001B02DAFB|nr:shikimate kinase [Paenibacillus sp. J31TS4]GIP39758.1 shikimate kinase [Paenibacillus sp. J31TS4]
MAGIREDKIVLIGFMGTGKSTVGRALAERLGWTFVDSDEEAEKREGRSIRDMFEQDGEAYFRRQEHETLAALLERSGVVIATGGGAVLAEANRTLMKEKGLVAALTALPETIIGRVGADGNRPLLQGNAEERVRALLEERKEAYLFADVTVATDGKPVPDIVDELTAILGRGAGLAAPFPEKDTYGKAE